MVHAPPAGRAARTGDLVDGLTLGRLAPPRTGGLVVTMDGMLRQPADPIERATWMSELVYGTLAALIAMAGIEVAGGASPTGAGAVILVGAAATWFAHAYSAVLGRRTALGHTASPGQIMQALRHAWPIILAAIPSVLAFGGASLGWWSSGIAMSFSNGAGIAVLAGVGYLAGRAAGEDLAGLVSSTVLTASIGIAIVVVELLLHR